MSADAVVSSNELERARRQSARGNNSHDEHNAMVSDNATTSVDLLGQNLRSETAAVAKKFFSRRVRAQSSAFVENIRVQTSGDGRGEVFVRRVRAQSAAFV